MRAATVVVLSLVAAVAAAKFVPHQEADKDVLAKQLKLLPLLYHVQQPILFDEAKEIAKTYKPIEHLDNYLHKEIVETFWKYYTTFGSLPRGEVFSIYYKRHLDQTKGLFDLLYYAKDFDSFYKTAVWAREHLNEAQFVYAFTVAVLHREDTKGVTLPAPYEIFPQLFVNTEVIQKAYDARLQGRVSSEQDPYYIFANYSGFPEASNPEELISYFTEDVGLNCYYAYLQYQYPYWLSPKNYSIPEFQHRGETFFSILQQLLARYYLERLSNHLPDVKPVDYSHPVLVGYYPQLRLQNGREAPARPEGVYPSNIDFLYLEEIKNYERRIRDSIDYGYASGYDYSRYNLLEKDLTNIIGNLVEGNADSIHNKFYGSVYRNLISLFGHIVDPVHRYGVPASALEQPETQLRDPLFYRIAKRVLTFYYQYKNQLQPYTTHDLEFPGVSVESVSFDKLVTYFDSFNFEINNALSIPNAEEGTNAKLNFFAHQYRLNHKPFYFHIKINSEKETNSVIRVFYGPKYDVYGRLLSLEERKKYYVLLDIFSKKLTAGENDIKRDSNIFNLAAKEAPHFSELYFQAEKALEGKEKYFLDQYRSHFGLPQRLVLPRGTYSGLPLSVFVIVSPAAEDVQFPRGPYVDGYAPGFPFDRRAPEFVFSVPNAHFDETFVVHRRLEDINTTA